MKQISDGEKIRRRKRVETEWLPRWRGKLSDPAALLDLQRWYLRRGCIDIEAFRRFKREHGFYDKSE